MLQSYQRFYAPATNQAMRDTRHVHFLPLASTEYMLCHAMTFLQIHLGFLFLKKSKAESKMIKMITSATKTANQILSFPKPVKINIRPKTVIIIFINNINLFPKFNPSLS
ncbi:hypothetical protein JOC94_001430 [Bacillus thermophilus]|uniref:Uncharacterized protein n=1 Tax=Siminovitchia thermophila TaxID=1245522 RepID=A0ABS2R4A7_9BACI|nr:hypothetical protein [Siminovitchia thermophila]MBM7714458.1 hypothetical protein [Siminovitchia thermophila]